MNLRLRRRRDDQCHEIIEQPAHRMTSDFDLNICRFTLDCVCGAHYDTRYIDEVHELREMHETMAPLIDALET